MPGVQPMSKQQYKETGKLQILNEPLHLFYLVLQIMDPGPSSKPKSGRLKSSNISCLTIDTEMPFTNSQQAFKPLFPLFPFPFSLSPFPFPLSPFPFPGGMYRRKNLKSFSTIILPVSWNHRTLMQHPEPARSPTTKCYYGTSNCKHHHHAQSEIRDYPSTMASFRSRSIYLFEQPWP